MACTSQLCMERGRLTKGSLCQPRKRACLRVSKWSLTNRQLHGVGQHPYTSWEQNVKAGGGPQSLSPETRAPVIAGPK